jgi:adenosylcobinamide kinase/adenosylcobinamide-phosphate guanylyltransferase
MAKIIYITGGARSGKSSLAQSLAKKYKSVAYIATGVDTDEEMHRRINLHKQSRPAHWETFEQTENIDQMLIKGGYDAYLLDCVTVLITNIIFAQSDNPEEITIIDQERIERTTLGYIEKLLTAAAKSSGDLILVSNEVGMGLVPEYSLSRFFRDLAGRANQMIAERADEAYLVVSGIPLRLKGV